MPRTRQQALQFRRCFPARLAEVDRFCITVRRALRATARQSAAFTVELVLREMLNNAVIHGCRRQAHLYIRCWLIVAGRTLVIRVADPGPGFNWRAERGQTGSPQAVSGRGLRWLRTLCSTVTYNSQGNIVTIRRRI